MAKKKIKDLELTKILLDPRRMKIMDIAEENPITVTQIAEILKEKPSRLYYHVKKLEDAGFLELVETKQQGNLIEKYYQTNRAHLHDLDESLLQEHSEEIMTLLQQVISPGLKLLENNMKNRPKYENPAQMSITYRKQSIQEWLETTHNAANDRTGKENVEAEEEDLEIVLKKYAPEDLKKEHRFVYVTLSYRLEDAEVFGGEIPQLPADSALSIEEEDDS